MMICWKKEDDIDEKALHSFPHYDLPPSTTLQLLSSRYGRIPHGIRQEGGLKEEQFVIRNGRPKLSDKGIQGPRVCFLESDTTPPPTGHLCRRCAVKA